MSKENDYLLKIRTPCGHVYETWYHNLKLVQSRAKRARDNGCEATIYLLIDAMLLPEDQW